jgi:tRNA-2-methylthio-N6-dimethylallyladenosine synthase
MKGHVSETVKDERLQRLQALLAEQQHAFTQSRVGMSFDVLIDKPGRRAGQKAGRSPWLQPVIVDEHAGGIGDIIPVRIVRTEASTLFAETL